MIENDYGYFDRNDALDKNVIPMRRFCWKIPITPIAITVMILTLEGLAKLNDRLESHNANVTYKLYESHHYQFIPEMLIEFLKKTYPKQ